MGSWESCDPLIFMEGTLHDVSEHGDFQIDRTCRKAGLLAPSPEAGDNGRSDLVQAHVSQVFVPTVESVCFRFERRGTLCIFHRAVVLEIILGVVRKFWC